MRAPALSAQFVEPGQAVGPQHNCLAVNREALAIVKLLALSAPRGSDGLQSRGPVIGVARVQPHRRAIAAYDQSVPVMLNLVTPIGAERWFRSHNRLGGDYEAGRKTLDPHSSSQAIRTAPLIGIVSYMR